MNHVVFYIMWTARCVCIVYMGTRRAVARRASRGSVVLLATSCQETSAPAIHVDTTMTQTTYLNTFADQAQPFMAALGSYSRIITLLRTSVCWLGLQSPQISIKHLRDVLRKIKMIQTERMITLHNLQEWTMVHTKVCYIVYI